MKINYVKCFLAMVADLDYMNYHSGFHFKKKILEFFTFYKKKLIPQSMSSK